MTNFRVMIRGRNCLVLVDGKPSRMGFIVPVFVLARTEHEAALYAIGAARERAAVKIINAKSDLMEAHATEATPVKGEDVPAIPPGFAWFREPSD